MLPCKYIPLRVVAGFHCMETARNELELCQSKMSVCIKVMSYCAFIVLYPDHVVHLEKMCERTLCKHAWGLVLSKEWHFSISVNRTALPFFPL